MESALRPREIQARIRAGESVADVAAAAGVPEERIAGFTAPVIAERDHVAGSAQASPVRRRGELTTQRLLRQVMAERLGARGIDSDTVRWDAWRREDRTWLVVALFTIEDDERRAEFVYDQVGRFSVAGNDEARLLLGERVPGLKGDSDYEPTIDLDDELALVRATQEGEPVEVTEQPTDEPAAAASPDQSPYARPAVAEAESSEADGDGDADDSSDAFVEDDLREVDGVYDIVPGGESDMDILYDMLSSYNEDSVEIYAGLSSRPARTTDDQDEPTEEPAEQPTDEPTEEPTERPMDEPADEPVAEPAEQSTGASVTEPTDADADRDAWLADEAFESHEDAPAAPADDTPPPAEPEQLSLLDPGDDQRAEAAPAAQKPAPKPRAPRQRKKRASVPTWDEIMFGGPTPAKPQPTDSGD